jgi:hypothetical protein
MKPGPVNSTKCIKNNKENEIQIKPDGVDKHERDPSDCGTTIHCVNGRQNWQCLVRLVCGLDKWRSEGKTAINTLRIIKKRKYR